MEYDMNPRRVLLLATGGTIACRPTENGALAPAITSDELLELVPELSGICRIDAIQVCNLDSTNMGPENWLEITEVIRKHYLEYDGFVITHGTDTMAYTAAALSYLIRNPDRPVILTGSQKSIYNRDTDAHRNLLCAVRYAAAPGAWGVQIVFDNKVILGTRARKVRSKSYNAFASINYPETAVFRGDRLVFYKDAPAVREKTRFYTELDPGVFVLRLVPGSRADIFEYLKGHYRAVVIESYGVGGLPSCNHDALLKALQDWSKEGRLTVFSTQTQYEGSDLGVYEVGRAAMSLPGVLEAYDMTPEAIVTKLMWVLAQTHDPVCAGALFHSPVQFDLL